MDNVPETVHQREEATKVRWNRAGLVLTAAALAAMTLLAYGLLLARAGAAEEPVVVRTCDGGEEELSSQEARMVELHNEAREEAGKDYLCVNPALSDAAGVLADDMIERDYFDHTDPDGGTMEDRLTQAGYDDYENAGENIAWGMEDTTAAEDRFEALMGSQKHKENILNEAYREIGVGYAAGALKDKEDAGVYAINFGSHGAEAPHDRPEPILEETEEPTNGLTNEPTGGQTGGETSVIQEPIPDATRPEPTGPEETQQREQTQIIQETNEEDKPGGLSEGNSPDVQAMICEKFGHVRKDVIGGLQSEGDGPGDEVKGRIADDFQDDFLNPGYCDFDPVGNAGNETGRDAQE